VRSYQSIIDQCQALPGGRGEICGTARFFKADGQLFLRFSL
jgi:hypothetical protein